MQYTHVLESIKPVQEIILFMDILYYGLTRINCTLKRHFSLGDKSSHFDICLPM